MDSYKQYNEKEWYECPELQIDITELKQAMKDQAEQETTYLGGLSLQNLKSSIKQKKSNEN